MCWEYLEANKCYYKEPAKEDKRAGHVERVEEKRREGKNARRAYGRTWQIDHLESLDVKGVVISKWNLNK
jgi:hypothetical protein